MGVLACSLVSASATPTATVEVLPTIAATDTVTVQASDTPAPTTTASPSKTPDALSQSMPMPFTNMMGVSQYFNPVGQPVAAWNGIPIMPQATAGQEFIPGQVYGFKASSTIAQAVSFYEAKIPALGFTLNGAGPGSGSSGTGSNKQHNGSFEFYKGTQILLIYIDSYDSDPNTIFVVISTQ
jgi:hypothetical protein